ncbi:hypothetical protein A79_4799 [Vibrio parahaemolyticus AQ3810]|nr:hypothetical protein A79_4799 [Vibrio parahaemolyticus AQ3810]
MVGVTNILCLAQFVDVQAIKSAIEKALLFLAGLCNIWSN